MWWRRVIWASRAKVAVEPVTIHEMPMMTAAAIKTMVRNDITHSSLIIIMPSLPFGDFSFCEAHRLGSFPLVDAKADAARINRIAASR